MFRRSSLPILCEAGYKVFFVPTGAKGRRGSRDMQDIVIKKIADQDALNYHRLQG